MTERQDFYKDSASREFPEKGQPHISFSHGSTSPAKTGEVAFKLPNCFKKHQAPRSYVDLFIQWVKLADDSPNGVIPVPLHGWNHGRTTVWRAINWLMKRNLMKRMSHGVGRGNASLYWIIWTFDMSGHDLEHPLQTRKKWQNSIEYSALKSEIVPNNNRKEIIKEFLNRMNQSNHSENYNPQVILNNLTSQVGSHNRSRAYANPPEKRKQSPRPEEKVKTCKARHQGISPKPKRKSKLYKHRWEGAKRYALAKIRKAEKTSINIESDAWKVICTTVAVHLPRLLESGHIKIGKQVDALVNKTIDELNRQSQVMPCKFQNFEEQPLLPKIVGEAEERKFKKTWRRNLFTDISKILIQNALLISNNAQATKLV